MFENSTKRQKKIVFCETVNVYKIYIKYIQNIKYTAESETDVINQRFASFFI